MNRIYLLSLIIFADSICLHSCEEVHAIILARGGSKGIKDKNLAIVDGLSILARAIVTIKNSKLFEHIWVSSDSERILKEAVKYGALAHLRPTEYAQDHTTSLDSVKEFLQKHPTINQFALFQCTSVFLKEHYIKEAFDKFGKKDCVFAVTRSHKLRWSEVNGNILPINFDHKSRPRRQDWKGELTETGMFYFSTRNLINQNIFQNERCAVVEIEAQDSLEIDTPSDLELARCLVEQ